MQISQKDVLLVVIRSFFAFAFVFHRSRWQNGNHRHKRCSSTRISSNGGRTSRASRARAIRASRASRIDSIRLNMSTRTLNLINLNSLNLNLSTLNLLTTLHNLFTIFNLLTTLTTTLTTLLTTLTILLNILTAFTALSITVFFHPKTAGRTNWNRWPSRLYLLSTSSLGRGYRNATFIKNLLSPTMKGN